MVAIGFSDLLFCWFLWPGKNKVTPLNHMSYLNPSDHQPLFKNLAVMRRIMWILPWNSHSLKITLCYFMSRGTCNNQTWKSIFQITFYWGKVHVIINFPKQFSGMKVYTFHQIIVFMCVEKNTYIILDLSSYHFKVYSLVVISIVISL